MEISWNELLQALMIALAIHMMATLWKSMKERMSRPAGGEPMPEPDLEMGMGIVGEGIDHTGSFAAHGSVADSDDDHREGNLELTKDDTAGLPNGTAVSGERASEQDVCISAITDHLPKVQLEITAQVTDRETIGASVPVVVDDSHARQVEVLTKNINQALLVEGVNAGHDGV